MGKLKGLQIFLWDIDPGYFRLKHAAKTILAILIALYLVRNDSYSTKLITGFVCGVSMQPVVANSFSSRALRIFIFDLAYFAAFVIGLHLRDLPTLRTVVLIVLGFTVNYMRRFGLHNSMTPMMVWLLCFFATILPLDSTVQDGGLIHGLVVGLSVSTMVILFVFPDNFPRLFVSNSNRIFRALAKGMKNIRRHVLTAEIAFDFENLPFVRVKERLNRLLNSNRAIEEQDGLFESQQQLISELLIHEYALIQAYNVLIDAYRILRIHNYQLPQSIRVSLIMVNKQFALLFESMCMQADYSVQARKAIVSLKKLNANLAREGLADPSLIMILLNLKLSFNLFNQHVSALLRGDNVP